MKITKANGETAPFDKAKIRHSLKRVHASKSEIKQVTDTVKDQLYEGMSTAKLYRIVFNELKKLKKGAAGRYNLKRAIMALGPSGFPFEQFVAAIWKFDGFSVETNVVIDGACVSHEVDVVSDGHGLQEFIECKHHSVRGKVCTVKIPLYFQSRFLDIEKQKLSQLKNTGLSYKGWLVTNMRFTSEAIKYGTCAGLGLLSWDYPPKNGLRDRIDKAGLHPITSLTSISRTRQQKLMRRSITLCRELCERSEVLDSIGIHGSKAELVIEEARAICGSGTS